LLRLPNLPRHSLVMRKLCESVYCGSRMIPCRLPKIVCIKYNKKPGRVNSYFAESPEERLSSG